MTDTPTLDNLLSQTDDATVKRLILDAYKLGVADGYARDRVKPNYPHDRGGVYLPITHEYIDGTKPQPYPDIIKAMQANMGIEEDGA